MNYTEEDFKKLLNGLINNLLNARHHFFLYRQLVENAIPEYEEEMNQCKTFWHLTIGAHQEVGILSLCRAYDGNNKSLSLLRFLQVISENLELFDRENFCERLKDNPFVESLAETHRKPNLEEIESEKTLVSKTDPLVKNLTIIRGHLIAHTNENWILKNKNVNDIAPLSIDDIQKLIDRGFHIYNKYSSLFQASEYASIFPGENDLHTVLEHYRIGEKFKMLWYEIEVDISRRSKWS